MSMLKEYLFLDPRHFTSMSVYGAACAKFKSRSIVECMPNEAVMEAIEQSTHGGFSNVSTRRGVSSANYEEPMYIRDDGEVLRVMSMVEALDDNNQYGGKMIQKLCRGGFRHRMAQSKVLLHECKTLVHRYDKVDNYGYLFQISMVLPQKYHTGREELGSIEDMNLFGHLMAIYRCQCVRVIANGSLTLSSLPSVRYRVSGT